MWSVIHTCGKLCNSSSMSPCTRRDAPSIPTSESMFIPRHDYLYCVPPKPMSSMVNLRRRFICEPVSWRAYINFFFPVFGLEISNDMTPSHTCLQEGRVTGAVLTGASLSTLVWRRALLEEDAFAVFEELRVVLLAVVVVCGDLLHGYLTGQRDLWCCPWHVQHVSRCQQFASECFGLEQLLHQFCSANTCFLHWWFSAMYSFHLYKLCPFTGQYRQG